MAESVDQRVSAKRNLGGSPVVGTQRPTETEAGLVRVREAARRDRLLRFNNLLHHVTVRLLKRAYWPLHRKAAPGVDAMDWRARADRAHPEQSRDSPMRAPRQTNRERTVIQE